jgi:Ca-activated chloride channel family protein
LGLTLLSYKEKGEDGFFLLLLAPKVEADKQEVLARDVVIVLDTSGSMRGTKLKQAQDALAYILENLNAEDRFNIVSFSSGVRRYASTLQPVSKAEDALRFVRGLQAEGGTNIDRALTEALSLFGPGERPQIVLFLTDGLATEGVVETQKIIANVAKSAPRNARLFTFGIGDEVNTILLDTIAQEHRGASAYVRPMQSISEVVSAFYAKVGAPLLADLQIDWGGMLVEELYPYPLPDLFAGGQLLVVGRYRQGGSATVTLGGKINERVVSYRYPGVQLATSGGESFIPRLWAMRKIGYLLNEIRLRGEDKELIDEIVALSVRYGVMTPYTAFLVDETEDVLTEAGRGQAANRMYEQAARATPAAAGAPAVDRSVGQKALQDSAIAAAPTMAAAAPGAVEQSAQVKYVGDVSFVLRQGVWTDTRYDPARLKPRQIRFGSDAYFTLLSEHPEWGRYLAVGARVIVILDGQAYEIAEQGDEIAPPVTAPTTTPTPLAAIRMATPAVVLVSPWERFWGWLNELLR